MKHLLFVLLLFLPGTAFAQDHVASSVSVLADTAGAGSGPVASVVTPACETSSQMVTTYRRGLFGVCRRRTVRVSSPVEPQAAPESVILWKPVIRQKVLSPAVRLVRFPNLFGITPYRGAECTSCR